MTTKFYVSIYKKLSHLVKHLQCTEEKTEEKEKKSNNNSLFPSIKVK